MASTKRSTGVRAHRAHGRAWYLLCGCAAWLACGGGPGPHSSPGPSPEPAAGAPVGGPGNAAGTAQAGAAVQPAPGEGGSATDESDLLRSAPAAATLAAMDEPTPAMVNRIYVHVRDDDGTEAGSGVDVALLFERGGGALLYVAGESDGLGHQGTWSYDDGRLTLRFTADDFHPDATFPLDLAAEDVTMPFRVFSPDAGSSQWARRTLDPLLGAKLVFQGLGLDPDRPPTLDEALARAAAQANALLAGERGNRPTPPVAAKQAADGPPPIWAVEPAPGGLRVFYENGLVVPVILFPWPIWGVPVAPLQPGMLAADPRVRLDPESPHDGTCDPPNKRALFIAPFRSQRTLAALLMPQQADSTFASVVNWLGGTMKSGSEGFDFEGAERTLRERGYSVETVFDDDATLVHVLEALGARSGEAPGLLVFNTHSSYDGQLAVGVFLGRSEEVAWNAAARELEEIKAAFPDLASFEAGPHGEVNTVGQLILHTELGFPSSLQLAGVDPHLAAKGTARYFLTLKPAFWRWLAQRRHASYARSLVYTASCYTDSTPFLREAVAARAYLAFAQAAPPQLAGAVFNYLVQVLARPTRSVEEVYYDIMRVARTREVIYDQDLLFNGIVSEDAAAAFDNLSGNFHGYGAQDGRLIAYSGNGWLDLGRVDPGHVWWLLFTARWAAKPDDAYLALRDCWTQYWSSGQAPGLANLGCNAMTMGAGPSQDEVAYAQHLLRGMSDLSFSGTLVPRWTLDDGR